MLTFHILHTMLTFQTCPLTPITIPGMHKWISYGIVLCHSTCIWGFLETTRTQWQFYVKFWFYPRTLHVFKTSISWKNIVSSETWFYLELWFHSKFWFHLDYFLKCGYSNLKSILWKKLRFSFFLFVHPRLCKKSSTSHWSPTCPNNRRPNQNPYQKPPFT